MEKILFLCLSLLVPAGNLHAFYSVTEMKTADLKKRLFIQFKVSESDGQMHFTIALMNSPKAYWNSSLDLVDTNGVVAARVCMRGEEICRVLYEGQLKTWQWENFKPAEVYTFSVDPKLLDRSVFRWETGPRNNEHGVAYGGGMIYWCYLKTIVEMAKETDNTGSVSKRQSSPAKK